MRGVEPPQACGLFHITDLSHTPRGPSMDSAPSLIWRTPPGAARRRIGRYAPCEDKSNHETQIFCQGTLLLAHASAAIRLRKS